MQKQENRCNIIFRDLHILQLYFEREISVKKILFDLIEKILDVDLEKMKLINYLQNEFNFCKFVFCFYFVNLAFENCSLFSHQDFFFNTLFIMNHKRSQIIYYYLYLATQEILTILNLSKNLYYSFFQLNM